MFGIGFTEFVLIAVVVLLVFGPEKIPVVARTVARFYREVRTTGQEFTDVFKKELVQLDNEMKDLVDPDVEGTGGRFASFTREKAEGSAADASAAPAAAPTPEDWLETVEERFDDA